MLTMTRTLHDPLPIVSCLADDPDLRELVALYAQEMPQRIETLEKCFAACDWQALVTCAHQMKGAAGSHGFHQLTPFAAALEVAAREARADAIQAALDALVDVCRRVR